MQIYYSLKNAAVIVINKLLLSLDEDQMISILTS